MSEVFGGNMFFPIHNTGHGEPFDEGVSLRDYCAIEAMKSLLLRNPGAFLNAAAIKIIVQDSFDISDAMMKGR